MPDSLNSHPASWKSICYAREKYVKRETKWGKVPCLRKQHDGRSLDPGPPDPKFEASTARPHIPTQGGL